jgi:RNA-directed DNA polymerase
MNKGTQPQQDGYLPAESVERRPMAKGNSGQTTVTGTQRPEATLSGLDRVRQAAGRDGKQRFTNLLHHVTVDLLSQAYFSLKREAAPGVDDVTWRQYGEGLALRLAELHERIQGER